MAVPERRDWTNDAKANWRELCDFSKGWYHEASVTASGYKTGASYQPPQYRVSRQKVYQRYECSTNTVTKLSTIISPLVDEENKRLEEEFWENVKNGQKPGS